MARDSFGWIGSVVEGKYRIESVVGEGGFGVVYAAQHLGFGTRVAVKCLKLPGNLDEVERQRFLEGFLAEGKLLHQLSRANAGIVQAHDIGATDSPNGTWTPYLVLEWLDGVTLEDDLADRSQRGVVPRSLAEALALFEGAAGALATAHAQSVAHRDVKPANIFLAKLGGERRTKVLDFGIAKVMTETTNLTKALASTGQSIRAFTPQYGAPEQFSPRFGATGTWTDVYALALVLVEVLSGKAALIGSDTTQLFIQSTDKGERPTPRARGVAVPDAVEAVLLRALQVEPRDRFRTVGEFWSALSGAAAGSSPEIAATLRADSTGSAITALAPIPREREAVVGASEVPTTGGTTTSPQVTLPSAPPATQMGDKRRSAAAVGLGLAVCVLGVGGAFWGTRARTGEVVSAPTTPSASVPSVVAAAPPGSEAIVDTMVSVQAGTFLMGANDGEAGEKPLRSVQVAAFQIDRSEVTTAAYEACVRAGACAAAQVGAYCNAGKPEKANHPINCVTWDQAMAHCGWSGKRLPSEQEWEYAARGTDGRKYPWGNEVPTNQACWNRTDAVVGSCPVGSFSAGASPYGALDMAGNVAEWTSSKFDADGRVIRGGGWTDVEGPNLRASYRGRILPTLNFYFLGFRCAR